MIKGADSRRSEWANTTRQGRSTWGLTPAQTVSPVQADHSWLHCHLPGEGRAFVSLLLYMEHYEPDGGLLAKERRELTMWRRALECELGGHESGTMGAQGSLSRPLDAVGSQSVGRDGPTTG